MSKVFTALNEQVNHELYSGYLYLSMSACMADMGLPGFARWLELQAAEELTHAKKMYAYIISRGERVTLAAIDQPPARWESALSVMQEGLAHEKKVTGLINGLMTLALAEHDHATGIFLQWFVTEQIEEEQSFQEMIANLKLAGNSGEAILMLDREAGKRVGGADSGDGSADV